MSISYFSVPLSRIFCYYGNTNDAFVDESLVPLDISQTLFHELKKNGYERILFYGGNGVTFLDKTSRELWNGRTAQQQTAVPLPDFLAGFAAPSDEDPDAGAPEPIPISDTDMLREMKLKLADMEIRTAIVIQNANQTLREFARDENEKLLTELLRSISQYDSNTIGNRNLLIFLFDDFGTEGEEGDIHTLLNDRKRAWTQYLSPDTKMTIAASHVFGLPNAEEVRALLNYLRLYGINGKQKLKMEVKDLEVVSHMLSVCLHDNLTAKEKNRLAEDFSFKQTMLKDLMEYLDFRFIRKNRVLDKKACEFVCRRQNNMPALERLNQMVGLQSVKEYVNRFVSVSKNAPKLPAPAPSRFAVQSSDVFTWLGKNVNLNLVLTGNPGTGKTTVAKLLGEIYYDLGFLSSGHTVKVTRADLVAGYVGQTAMKTKACIERAMGGVLFVDEAYMLRSEAENGSDFGQEAIDTILEAMSDRAGQFVVIVAGYEKEMQPFLHSNPGLMRRFKEVIHIADYSEEELFQIFFCECKKKGYVVDGDLEEHMHGFLKNWFRARDERWGNAGEMDKLIQDLYESWCVRCGKKNEADMPVLTIADIPAGLCVHLMDIEDVKKDTMKELNDLIGLREVKERIYDLQLEKKFEGSSEPGHYIFAGNPGTGKTTVARLMGELLCSAGALRRGHCIEVKRQDLVAEHLGGTAIKTRNAVKQALDGVLFIDEAYSLCDSGNGEYRFGQEAIDTLVAEMENHRDNLCVICAGYTEKMETFIRSNPGLKSRFQPPILFEDYDAGELLCILQRFAGEKYRLSDGFLADSRQVFEGWIRNKSKNFGNARDVRKYLDACKRRMRRRLMDTYGEDADVQEIPEEEKYLLTKADVAADPQEK